MRCRRSRLGEVGVDRILELGDDRCHEALERGVAHQRCRARLQNESGDTVWMVERDASGCHASARVRGEHRSVDVQRVEKLHDVDRKIRHGVAR